MPDSLDFDWAMGVVQLPDGRFDPPSYEAWGECLIDWWDFLGRLDESGDLYQVESIVPDATSGVWPYVAKLVIYPEGGDPVTHYYFLRKESGS